MYKVSDYYAPAYDGGIRWNDPDIAIPWPFKDADIITSDKDRRLPLLKEFASPFAYDGHPLVPLLHRKLIKFVPDPPRHDFRYAIDFSKLNAELGWSPQHSFETGLFRTVKWYLENRAWWEALLLAHDASVRRGLSKKSA